MLIGAAEVPLIEMVTVSPYADRDERKQGGDNCPTDASQT
jgi:hypothetical protein